MVDKTLTVGELKRQIKRINDIIKHSKKKEANEAVDREWCRWVGIDYDKMKEACVRNDVNENTFDEIFGGK